MSDIEAYLEPSGPVEIVPTVEAESVIRERGGLVYIWPKVLRGLWANMTLLRASTDIPVDFLDDRRVEVGRIWCSCRRSCVGSRSGSTGTREDRAERSRPTGTVASSPEDSFRLCGRCAHSGVR